MTDSTNSLKGQVAVVSGAGRGIGRAIAVAYAHAGAAVCCCARTEAELNDTVAMIEDEGGRAVAMVADVNDYASMHAVFDQTRHAYGGIDIVVVNAGISSGSSIEHSDPQEWRNVIDTNLTGAYHTVKAAIPHLKRRNGGKIILIGSGLGHRGVADTSAYACSKAGVWMLTRILAQELSGDGISVNELIPGPVKTGINPQDDDELRDQLGRTEWIKQPRDVIPLALFLAGQPKTGPTAQSFSLMRRDS